MYIVINISYRITQQFKPLCKRRENKKAKIKRKVAQNYAMFGNSFLSRQAMYKDWNKESHGPKNPGVP